MVKRLVSILLSFILLASHINLAIGTHFCGGEAVMSRLMIGHEHLSCGMANMGEPCVETKNQDVSFTNPPCCENHYQTFETTDDFVKNASIININIDFVASLAYSNLNVDIFSQSAENFYSDYSPPPLEKDVQTLFQTFII